MITIPWYIYPLSEWSIVGMNHYYINGKRYLFCAMIRGNYCIKAEGEQDLEVFSELKRLAQIYEDNTK